MNRLRLFLRTFTSNSSSTGACRWSHVEVCCAVIINTSPQLHVIYDALWPEFALSLWLAAVRSQWMLIRKVSWVLIKRASFSQDFKWNVRSRHSWDIVSWWIEQMWRRWRLGVGGGGGDWERVGGGGAVNASGPSHPWLWVAESIPALDDTHACLG